MSSSAGISHDLTSIGVSGALDNNTSLNASMVTDDGRGGLFVFGQKRLRDGYDADGDGFTDIPMINSITVGTRGHLRVNPFSKIRLEYHGTKEFRRGEIVWIFRLMKRLSRSRRNTRTTADL